MGSTSSCRSDGTSKSLTARLKNLRGDDDAYTRVSTMDSGSLSCICGVSLGCDVAADTKYLHSSLISGPSVGEVYAYANSGVSADSRHFIAVRNLADGNWRVYHWGNAEGVRVVSDLFAFACARICGDECHYIGRFSLDQVYAACFENSCDYECDPRGYDCNAWTQAVAHSLAGLTITCHARDCHCQP